MDGEWNAGTERVRLRVDTAYLRDIISGNDTRDLKESFRLPLSFSRQLR